MSNNTKTISLNGKEFKLIGTAHVSQSSIEEVKKVIQEEKPDVVCIELDEGRYNAITQNDNWEKLNLSKVFKEGKGFLLIANLVMASFQRRLGNELGVKPGEEMKAAADTAKELGIPHALCDREVQLTLRRAWARCGLWSKCKLLATLLASAFTTEKLNEKEIEELKNNSEIDGMMNELANYLPAVKEVLINERDFYLAAKIWDAAVIDDSRKKIVAVVGAGHMNGMIAHLEKLSKNEESSDVKDIETVPSPSFFSKIAKFIIPAIIIGLIAGLFINAGIEKGLEGLLQWWLWNSCLSAIGAIIALAHPLAVIASFVGAPFTSLNPFIGVGILSGLVQVTVRKPQVIDAQNVSEDGASFKGWYKNRITRALLVFFFSSLGSSIGTFIAGGGLVGMVARLFGN